MEINLGTVGKKNLGHCPSQPFEATPTKQFPDFFRDSQIFTATYATKADTTWLTFG